jgi:hypothetical protein
MILLLAAIIAHFYMPYKLKIARYILNGISILILIYFIVIIPLNWHFDKDYAKKIIGTYTINIDKSHYANANLNKFRSLTMSVKNDYTFEFNSATPFFPKTVGKWSNMTDGGMVIIKGTFDDSKIFDIYGYNTLDWIFRDSSLVNGKSTNKIIFEPVK